MTIGCGTGARVAEVPTNVGRLPAIEHSGPVAHEALHRFDRGFLERDEGPVRGTDPSSFSVGNSADSYVSR